MRSTFTGLNTMVRGIFANQLSLDTVGHNITNASTEGYSRQSVNLAATMCQMQGSIYGEVAVGTGVDSTSIVRARDVFADKQFRIETATQEYNNIMQQNYEKIETAFYDTEDSGILNAMDRFREAWQTLSTNASNSSYRKNVANEGIFLTNQINTAKNSLVDQMNLLYEELDMRVDNVDALTDKVVALNKQIVAMEAGGSIANDLRDQRDSVVDELSKYMDITVSETPEGYYSIVSNGVTLVNKVDKLRIQLSRGGSQGTSDINVNYGVQDYNLNIKETGTVFVVKNGALKGIIDAIDENKHFIDELANVSALLLTTFNAQHQSGYDFYGQQGGNFFGVADAAYSTYNYSEFKYDLNHESNYFYVYNGSEVLTGVDIIEELVVNPAFFTNNGENLIAAKNNDNSTGKDTFATAQGNNAVLLSDFFNMTRKYTEETNAAIKDLYYHYYDANRKTIDVYDDKFELDDEGNLVRELVMRGPEGTVYRNADGTFVDDQGNNLQITLDSDGNISGFSSPTYTTVSYTYNVDGSTLIYSGQDGVIYKTLTSTGEFTFTDGNGNELERTISNNGDLITYSNYTVHRDGSALRALGDISIYGYYNYSVSQLGLRAETMDLKVESQDELIVQIQNWRSSTMGVDWNEELTNMIKFQKGYGACARCLTAMDEMLDRLVNNTGMVGR